MDNIYDDVVSSLERPDLGQDHEGSLHQPDQLHLVLQQGVNYVQPFGLEVSWEKLGLIIIWQHCWSGFILWIRKEDPWNQFETISSAQGCSCSLSRAVEQLGYCHPPTNRGNSNLQGAPPLPSPAYCVGRDLGNSLLRLSSMEQQINWGFQLPTLYHHGFLRSLYSNDIRRLEEDGAFMYQ